MVPISVSCWEYNMRLEYNSTTHTTRNVEGLQTRIPGFGGTFSVEYLDKSKRSVGQYFSNFVDA